MSDEAHQPGTLTITEENGERVTFRTNEHWYTEGPAPDPLQELTTLTEELGLYDTPNPPSPR